jgi:hypothetical protein
VFRAARGDRPAFMDSMEHPDSDYCITDLGLRCQFCYHTDNVPVRLPCCLHLVCRRCLTVKLVGDHLRCPRCGQDIAGEAARAAGERRVRGEARLESPGCGSTAIEFEGFEFRLRF